MKLKRFTVLFIYDFSAIDNKTFKFQQFFRCNCLRIKCPVTPIFYATAFSLDEC